jgi:Mg-chelatase subunit ChlD
MGDFDLKENGQTRTIAQAQLSKDPMRIVLVVDSSAAMESLTNQFRAGMQRFFQTLPPSAEVALISVGNQARLRFSPTSDRKKLADAAAGFFPDGGGAAVLDGLMEGYNQFLRKAEARWPIIVLVTTDGPVAGTSRTDQFEKYLQQLDASAVTGHAIVISQRGKGIPAMVALNLAQSTRGFHDSIAAATALPDKMQALAEKLAGQFQQASSLYRLEYSSDPKAKQPGGVELRVLRNGVKLRVSNRRELN